MTGRNWGLRIFCHKRPHDEDRQHHPHGAHLRVRKPNGFGGRSHEPPAELIGSKPSEAPSTGLRICRLQAEHTAGVSVMEHPF